jgi:ubiquinone biosynthesis protein
MLPEMPRLIYRALQQQPATDPLLLRALLDEQRRTNRLLQGLLWSGLGFLLGLLLTLLMFRWHGS